MSIQRLQEADVHSLQSGLVYLDAVAVVKELVENALDTTATNIKVEVDFSAVGLIQVTDNGRGIHPMDRTLLGVHYCTSKIRTFQDVVTWDGVLSASVARHWPVLPKSVER